MHQVSRKSYHLIQQSRIFTVQRLVDRTRGGCGAAGRLQTRPSQAPIGVMIDAVRGRRGLARTVNVQAPADRPSSFGRQTRIGLRGWSCPLLAESQSTNCDIVGSGRSPHVTRFFVASPSC